MRRILLLCVGARALVAPGPARARRALRHAFDGDGFATSSDSFDVMDDEGWIHEGEERDAGVTIHSSMDCAEEPVDVSTYFFGNEDDDAELRRLLGELEAEFAGEADAASASILDSVRSCHEVLDGSAVDFELDARAALAFAATARGDAPGDEVAADAAPVAAGDAALAEAYAANAAHEDQDDAYSWLLGNATAGGTRPIAYLRIHRKGTRRSASPHGASAGGRPAPTITQTTLTHRHADTCTHSPTCTSP